jgi:glyoxylase-like metal-dependent hydrolase (beta-lactamase superfamily II)
LTTDVELGSNGSGFLWNERTLIMPETEAAVLVADDIYQVRLPLPFALNIVNCYLIRGNDGWTVLDTGLNTGAAQAAWNAAFDMLGITPRDINHVLLTHVHPDHYGMAGWFQSQAAPDAIPPVKLSAREAQLARLLWEGEGKQANEFDRFLAACGMPADMVATVAVSLADTIDKTFPHPIRQEMIEAGDEITIGKRTFKLIHAPGHSDGQLILYDAADKLLLSGDHILMKITPNIGLWPDTDPNPLGRYLQSLESLRNLEVRLALPGHKALITDWRGRLDELLHHHALRIDNTYAAIKGGATVYEASLKVFNSFTFSPHEWRFAMAETLAHLEYLIVDGKAREETDENGLRHFYPLT